METGPGSWSIKSMLWQDSGTYRLVDGDTWQVTGKLGTGTWKRRLVADNIVERGPLRSHDECRSGSDIAVARVDRPSTIRGAAMAASSNQSSTASIRFRSPPT